MTKIPTNQLYIRELKHEDDLSKFNSSSSDLNDFLKNDALRYHKKMIGKTFVCIYKDEIIAYMTLLTDSIRVREIQDIDREEEIQVSYYPAMKIGRLAVDNQFEGKGVGTFLLKAAVGKAIELSKHVACRFIILDSKRESIGFYKKHFFKLIKKYERKKYPTMYFDLLPFCEKLQIC